MTLPPRIFFTKDRLFFQSPKKKDLKTSSKQSIPPPIALLDTKDSVFKNQSKTFCQKAESFSLAQLSEKNNKNNYDVECIFDDLAKTYFCHKAGNLSLKVRKSLKCYDFSLKKIFHQNVPTKTRKAVLISLLKFFCRSAKKSFKCQKNWKTEHTKEPFASKSPSGQVESNFDNNARKLSTKSKVLLHVQKWNFFEVFETKFFSSRCYIGHLDSKLDTSLKTFCQMNKNFRSPNSRKDTGEKLFQIISFSLSCSHEHVDNRFYNMPVKVWEEVESVLYQSWKLFNKLWI